MSEFWKRNNKRLLIKLKCYVENCTQFQIQVLVHERKKSRSIRKASNGRWLHVPAVLI